MRTPQGTGWLARQQAAKAAMAAGHHPVADDPVSQERRAMYEAQAEADRLAREAAEAKISSTVSVCPCCAGKGHAPVPDAAAWVEARRRYDFVGWKPDMATIAELMRTAITVNRDGKPVAVQTTVNTLTVSGTDVDPAAVADAVQKRLTKSAKKAVQLDPPWLDPDAVLEP